MKRINTILIQVIALFIMFSTNAQVTIGSGEKANPGALLDLKQQPSTNSVTAKKGILLPNVSLKKENELMPMFEGVAEYQDGTIKSKQDELHTGLIVYNMSVCFGKGKGVYIWNGKLWNPMGNPSIEVFVNVDADTLNLPSGRDARSLVAKSLTVNWSPVELTTSWATAASGLFNPVPFAAGAIVPSGAMATSPTTMTLMPTAMTTAEIASNPWRTKESILTLTTSNCGTENITGTQTLVLNQTNYAIKANGSTASTRIVLIDNTEKNFTIEANATWKASLTGASILKTIATTAGTYNSKTVTGGKTLKDGTPFSQTFYYKSEYGYAGSRYQNAKIVYTDTESEVRLNKLEINVLQCQGTANYSNLDTSDLHKVQSHTDQNGNVFYSALFGTAGRWMVTNLAATTFASQRSDGRVNPLYLSGASGEVGNGFGEGYKTPFWGYPGGNSSSDASVYNTNPKMGVLYNFAAASGKKGVWGDYNSNEEGLATLKVQGICPYGWHLPTDKEWTDLENVLVMNTNLYSASPVIYNPPTVKTIPDITNTDINGSIVHGVYREDQTPLGYVFTDPCESGYSGRSLSPIEGGFAGLFVGYAADGYTPAQNGTYGTTSYWHTSSKLPGVYQNFIRAIIKENPNFYKGIANNSHMISVRCVKD